MKNRNWEATARATACGDEVIDEARKRTSIICASNHPSLPWNITSRVHKIGTTLKRRSNLHACIGKPLLPQKRCNPSFFESSSGGSVSNSSNPLSMHPRMKSIYVRKSFERTEFGLQFLDDRRAENTPWILSSSRMYGSTPWRTWEKKRAQRIGRCHTSSFEKKVPKRTGEEFTQKDWLHCLHSGNNHSIETDELCDGSVQRGDTLWFSTKGTHYDSLQKECHTKKITHEEVTHCLSCGSSTRSILCCRSWIGGRKKNVKKDIKHFSSPTAMQTMQKQLQMSRSPGRWMTKFIEDLNKMQSIAFTCPRRKNEFGVPVYAEGMRRKSCQ